MKLLLISICNVSQLTLFYQQKNESVASNSYEFAKVTIRLIPSSVSCLPKKLFYHTKNEPLESTSIDKRSHI